MSDKQVIAIYGEIYERGLLRSEESIGFYLTELADRHHKDSWKALAGKNLQFGHAPAPHKRKTSANSP